MKYQFIIISLTEERKNKTEQLLNIINEQQYSVYFIPESTIDNSSDFLPENSKLNENILKIICCTKSHLRSIEYACRDESPEYSIILEDDVTFHTDFNKIIHEIIDRWETNYLYSDIKMLNIGWVPCNNYNHYNLSEYNSFDELVGTRYKLLNYFYPVGLQGYLIKKSKLNDDMRNIISSDTFFEYSLKVFEKSIILRDVNKLSNSIYAIDNVLNKLLNFAVLFPPIIIERHEQSTLGHDNKNNYWDNYFRNNEEKINDYIWT